jgi:predicted small lipoprotein YifL
MTQLETFRKGIVLLAVLLLVAIASGCGKKGPPEPPNRIDGEQLGDR